MITGNIPACMPCQPNPGGKASLGSRDAKGVGGSPGSRATSQVVPLKFCGTKRRGNMIQEPVVGVETTRGAKDQANVTKEPVAGFDTTGGSEAAGGGGTEAAKPVGAGAKGEKGVGGKKTRQRRKRRRDGKKARPVERTEAGNSISMTPMTEHVVGQLVNQMFCSSAANGGGVGGRGSGCTRHSGDRGRVLCVGKADGGDGGDSGGSGDGTRGAGGGSGGESGEQRGGKGPQKGGGLVSLQHATATCRIGSTDVACDELGGRRIICGKGDGSSRLGSVDSQIKQKQIKASAELDQTRESNSRDGEHPRRREVVTTPHQRGGPGRLATGRLGDDGCWHPAADPLWRRAADTAGVAGMANTAGVAGYRVGGSSQSFSVGGMGCARVNSTGGAWGEGEGSAKEMRLGRAGRVCGSGVRVKEPHGGRIRRKNRRSRKGNFATGVLMKDGTINCDGFANDRGTEPHSTEPHSTYAVPANMAGHVEGRTLRTSQDDTRSVLHRLDILERSVQVQGGSQLQCIYMRESVIVRGWGGAGCTEGGRAFMRGVEDDRPERLEEPAGDRHSLCGGSAVALW